MNTFEILLPYYDFSERHAIIIRGQASDILDAVAAFRVQNDPLVRQIIRLRELPSRLMKRLSARPLDLEDFTLLARTGHALAYGLVGAFWHADYGLGTIPSPDAFMAARQGDLCKLVLGFTVVSISKNRCRLVTETRVLCLSDKARQRFTPYWFLIRPVSGVLRRRMLWNIRRIVEQHS
ncbi:hypothetical protein RAA17_22550 [Komagataeibacter rhaeticus]|nr:hypothetical protein [Komagataeibacter rhaeticus]